MTDIALKEELSMKKIKKIKKITHLPGWHSVKGNPAMNQLYQILQSVCWQPCKNMLLILLLPFFKK